MHNILSLNTKIVLTEWDWPNTNGPKYVEGVIIENCGDDKYKVRLLTTLKLFDNTLHQELIVEGRHKGYPITKIIPSKIVRLILTILPVGLARIMSPLIAVNIYTIDGTLVSIARVSLGSIYTAKLREFQG